jgi:hypothetical protein
VSCRGVDLKKYPETKIFMNTDSKIGGMVASLAMQMLFKFNKSAARSSAHALADPMEIKTAYEHLIQTGNELGLSMPITKSFEMDMERFATKTTFTTF